ncbi:MAG: Maf family nucleotide pyrophosphatase [Pseudomonadota bacterium]|nr:Maf family nucleotide pyrophosphatase [Pseudomonadota bacterium]
MSRTASPALILASTSRYRAELLSRLLLPFEVVAPGVDEAALPGESPPALALRLACAKARAVAALRPDAVVIGSDQVADLNGEAVGKPGNHERATAQLRRLSGQAVRFHTGVAVVHASARFEQAEVAVAAVRFRTLADAEIESYLRREQPYDCAGSARCEALGIALLERIDSDDPTTLIGLPLMRTHRMLRLAGIDCLSP